MFVCADGAEIERIEDQDDIALACKISKLDIILILVLKCEFRSGLSYGNRHGASSESNEGCQI
jgi:hypothetical protein